MKNEELCEPAFDIGDCVVTTIGRAFVGIVMDVYEQRSTSNPWVYKVHWNDGDETEEDDLNDIIPASSYLEDTVNA